MKRSVSSQAVPFGNPTDRPIEANFCFGRRGRLGLARCARSFNRPASLMFAGRAIAQRYGATIQNGRQPVWIYPLCVDTFSVLERGIQAATLLRGWRSQELAGGRSRICDANCQRAGNCDGHSRHCAHVKSPSDRLAPLPRIGATAADRGTPSAEHDNNRRPLAHGCPPNQCSDGTIVPFVPP